MQTNHRFAVSVHILTLLAASGTALTSEQIAESVDTNPVVIRRTMGHLRDHELVESRPGASGGWRLIRDPHEISLNEVYRAGSHADVLGMHSHPNPDCPIGGHIADTLGSVFENAQQAMEAALGRFTIADMLEDILAHSI